MADRDPSVTLRQVLAVLEAARDADRDMGESIAILQELITDGAGSEWCHCGHVEEAHSHHWRGRKCALCKCPTFRPHA